MKKAFSIVFFVTVATCNSVFAQEVAEPIAELKKTEVNVESVDVIVEEVK